METILHPTLPSQIFLSPRISPAATEETVLVAVVKGTYIAHAPGDPSTEPELAPTQIELNLLDYKFEPPFCEDGDPGRCFRVEHDLAAYKPRTDIVVLGAPKPPPTPTGTTGPLGGTWTETVRLGPDSMSRTFLSADAASPVSFGWQSRLADPRKAYAGDAGGFVPPEQPGDPMLPSGFDNRFFNGGLYQAGGAPAFPHPAPPLGATVITVRHESRANFDQGGTTITVTAIKFLHFPVAGPRAVFTYRSGRLPDAPHISVELPMKADTIVYDKASGTFYVVWRAVWSENSSGVPPDRYIRLAISGGT